MSSKRPSFIIVPGAWQTPAAYDKIITQLKDTGYHAVTVNLPSCDSADPKNINCTTDANAVRKQILDLIETQDEDVVIFCHSYGGIPTGGAARGLSKSARLKEGKKGGVLGLVYVSAFIVPEGSSLLETMGGQHAPYLNPNQPTEDQCTISSPNQVLYNDLPSPEAESMALTLRPTSMRAFDSAAPPAAWAEPEFEGKLAFLRCMLDQALPPLLQDMFIEKSGVSWKVKDIEASHSVLVSRPEEVVGILEGWIGEFGG